MDTAPYPDKKLRPAKPAAVTLFARQKPRRGCVTPQRGLSFFALPFIRGRGSFLAEPVHHPLREFFSHYDFPFLELRLCRQRTVLCACTAHAFCLCAVSFASVHDDMRELVSAGCDAKKSIQAASLPFSLSADFSAASSIRFHRLRLPASTPS